MTTPDLPEPAAWISRKGLRAIKSHGFAMAAKRKEGHYTVPLFTLDQLLAERQRAKECDPEACKAHIDAFRQRAETANELARLAYSSDEHFTVWKELLARAQTAEALAETNQFWAEKEHAEGVRLSERLKEAETIIEQQRKALKPLAASVFNDNGDMGVNLYTPDAETFVAAYFAERAAAQFMEAKP
jgi:hypothetical protein